MGLWDFLTPEEGQKRRKWLDSKMDELVAEPMNYFFGPTGVPGKVQTAGNALEFTDAGDMQAAADASRNLWNNPTIGNAAEYAAAGAALALPMYSHKMGEGIADLADDLVKGYDPNQVNAFRVWHGSPHDFDKFSMNKIGTGEGAQAYGHGLYFAESEDVARGYQDALSKGLKKDHLRAHGIGNFKLAGLNQFQKGVDPDVAYRDWVHWEGLQDTPELRAAFDKDWSERELGALYEVAIDAEPEDFIDFDAPFAAQPKVVQDHFSHLARGRPGPDGDELARRIESDTWRREAVRGGVKGIKYLDQGSRGAGDGTRNFVLFDDSLAHILSKNGQQINTPEANRLRGLMDYQ